MPAAKAQSARGGITSLHIWLIVFVALWLIFTVVAVLLYTRQEELASATRKAESDAEKYMRKGEAARFQPFLDVAGDKQSLAKVLDTERIELARLIGVADMTSARDAGAMVDDALKGLSKGAPSGATLPDTQSAGLLTVVDRLQAAWKEQARSAVEATNRLKEATTTLKSKEDQLATVEKDFQKALADKDAQVKQVEADKAKFQAQKDQQVKDLQTRIGKMRDEADEQLIKAQADTRKATQQIDTLRTELKRTQEQLTQFRPKVGSLGLATQADAEIIRARPEEGVVYINLGQNDHLMLGLRFQVFSASKDVDQSGQGKGVIEVVGIQPQTAECRVISSNPLDPMVVGDLAINVVYDRNRKYRFVVEGQFDLAGTGRSDPQDFDRIKAWVEGWGGEVVTLPQVFAKAEKCPSCGQPLRQQGLGFETVDFLVLGAPPPTPGRITDETKPEERARIEVQRAAFDRYTRIEQQAKELGVAILSQSQFLHFIGYNVKGKTGSNGSPERGKQAAMGQ
jgi:hypothetical protein